jgi:membrane associated rhomboid family serine protease
MAFLSPHAPHQPVFRAPWVVVAVIAFLVAAHVARSLAPPEQSFDWLGRLAFIPARLSPAFLAGHAMPFSPLEAALSFVTYMAVHNDYTHLAINCLWLLAFGPIVARRFGTVLFLLFFIVCGAAAAAAHLAFNWASLAPVIGASGAISGLMAVGIRLLPTERPAWAMERAAAQPAQAPMLPLLSRQVLMFSILWVVLNIVAGFTGFGLAGESGLIAWQAHLGGYAAGLILSGSFDRLRPEPVGQPL